MTYTYAEAIAEIERLTAENRRMGILLAQYEQGKVRINHALLEADPDYVNRLSKRSGDFHDRCIW